MRTIIVEGQGWRVPVDVDEEVFPKYTDMTFEAMTQGVEKFLQNKYEPCPHREVEAALGFSIKAYEEGYENDMEKEVEALTEYVLRNASFYELAEQAREVAIAQIKKEQGNL
jgi:hypothetical protein